MTIEQVLDLLLDKPKCENCLYRTFGFDPTEPDTAIPMCNYHGWQIRLDNSCSDYIYD